MRTIATAAAVASVFAASLAFAQTQPSQPAQPRPQAPERRAADRDKDQLSKGLPAAMVKAGDIVVFSSLAPHATGPNLTTDIRKAFIAEYIPEGAVSVHRDKDGSIVPTVCNLPRHLVVLKDGQPPMDAAA
jgi:ectoine hydroxylase-related dioxygenase (phytanoyl-CoA dioxygenase family)